MELNSNEPGLPNRSLIMEENWAWINAENISTTPELQDIRYNFMLTFDIGAKA